MNIHEIYSLLLAGKTLQLEFESDGEAEKFRVKLSQYKSRQHKAGVSVGLFTDTDRQRLSFAIQRQLNPAPPILATICFKDPGVLRQYVVRILEEEEEQEDAADD